MIMNTKLYDNIIPTFMKESCNLSMDDNNECNDISLYFDVIPASTQQPPLLEYETSISIISCDDESSRGTTTITTTTSLSSFDTSLSTSTQSMYNDERSISLMTAEYSVNALLDCLSKNGVQHVSIDTSFDNNNDLDYLHIVTMAHNHVINLLKSQDILVCTKKLLIDALINAWKDLNKFLSIQHQIAYKSYHKIRHEFDEQYRILPKNDHFVHPNIYAKIKHIQQHKVQKSLIFLNEVSELYCSSLKGLALTQNLII